MNLTLKTDRLVLRPIAEDDVDIGVELWTDQKVMRYVREPYTPEQVVDDMPETCDRGGGGCIGVWCIVDVATSEKLGSAVLLPLPIDLDDTDWSLVQRPDIAPGEIEIGYLLKPSAWGRGYATEATRRLLKFAFEETPLTEIVAVTDPDNKASQHVLLKCGLNDEGPRRAYNEDDCAGFRISKADWLAQR